MEGTIADITVKFWGTRGSIPTSFLQSDMDAALETALTEAGPGDVGSADAARAFLARRAAATPRRYGGETTCVEFTNSGGGRVIVDFGSGVRRLGDAAISAALAAGESAPAPFSFLMTHMHWDHVQGLPFFAPAYMKDAKVRIGGGHGGRVLEQALFDQFEIPFFPVPRDFVVADISFFDIPADKSFDLEGFRITPILLHHGGGAYGYRFEYGGSSVCFASDAEHDQKDINKDYNFVKWARKTDLLIFDAQYSFVDLVLNKCDWGHSSGLIAVDIAHCAEVSDVLLTHHDPAADDRMVHNMVVQTREYVEMLHEGGLAEVAVDGAFDGLVRQIG